MSDFSSDSDGLSLFDLSKKRPPRQPSRSPQTRVMSADSQPCNKLTVDAGANSLSAASVDQETASTYVDLLSSSPSESENDSFEVIECSGPNIGTMMQQQPPAKKRHMDTEQEKGRDTDEMGTSKLESARSSPSFNSPSQGSAPKRSDVTVICKAREIGTKTFKVKRDQPLSDIALQLYPDITDPGDVAIFKGSLEVFPDYTPEDLVDDDEDEVSLEFVYIKASEQADSQAANEQKFSIRVNIKNGKPIALLITPSTSISEIIKEVLEKSGVQSDCAVLEFDNEKLDNDDLVKDTEIEEDDVLDIKF